MQHNNQITIFIILTTVMIFLLAVLIVSLLYLYKGRQIKYYRQLGELKLSYEQNILESQIEVQEQTFRHISREIHDNINLSLTLAKLNLNTLDTSNHEKIISTINSSIELISEVILSLTNISRSLNSDVIRNMGFHNSVCNEIKRVSDFAKVDVKFKITGEPVFLNSEKELLLFRMIQESLNNTIKYAQATYILLELKYSDKNITISIEDNGVGFIHDSSTSLNSNKSGLLNMQLRTKALGGNFSVDTLPGHGTKILISIPY